MNLNHGVIGRCKSRVRWHNTPGLTETVVCFAWQAEGQLRLMFQDEARFGRISDIPM
ncbi:hypothetical protein [Nitrosomonas communis]|uniref:hypothetical protein n=1 Tax=Nitrosomonas communis TaxID=44574 RepID=UPI003D2C8226